MAPSQQAAGAIYYAQQKLGTPYLWGGNGTAEQGGRFDCSGLTQAAYRSVDIELPGSPTTSTTRGRIPRGTNCSPVIWSFSPTT